MIGGQRHSGRRVVDSVWVVKDVCVSRGYGLCGWRVLAAHDEVRWDMGLFPVGVGFECPDARRGAWWCAVSVGGSVL
jgi:hypothetical protein